MKNKLRIISLFILSTIVWSKVQAQDAKEIAYSVYNREAPKDGESDMTMTLINKKGSERVRSLHKYFMDLENIEKQLLFFKAPSDVKNTAFMNWSYDDADKNDDQWLYLPALKKVKRISSSSKDNSFMGSDYTYADMEKRNPERDVHRFVKSETLNNEACWVVEATPIEEEQYSKKVAWISKTRTIPLKIDFYDEDEVLLKTLHIIEVEKVANYWIITKQEMKNVQKNHMTRIELTNLKIDQGLSAGFFTQRQMQKGL